MRDPLVHRVVARFLARGSMLPPAAKNDAYEALKHSKMHELVMAMSAEAKKDGERFGMRDAKKAMELWFDGGKEPTDKAQEAARRLLMSDKGKNLLKNVTDAVVGALKKTMSRVGYKDVGEAIVAFLGE